MTVLGASIVNCLLETCVNLSSLYTETKHVLPIWMQSVLRRRHLSDPSDVWHWDADPVFTSEWQWVLKKWLNSEKWKFAERQTKYLTGLWWWQTEQLNRTLLRVQENCTLFCRGLLAHITSILCLSHPGCVIKDCHPSEEASNLGKKCSFFFTRFESFNFSQMLFCLCRIWHSVYEPGRGSQSPCKKFSEWNCGDCASQVSFLCSRRAEKSQHK